MTSNERQAKSQAEKLLGHGFSLIRGEEDHSMVMRVLHWETAKPAIPDTDIALCAKRRSRSANRRHAPNLSGSEYTGAGPIGHMNTLDAHEREDTSLYTPASRYRLSSVAKSNRYGSHHIITQHPHPFSFCPSFSCKCSLPGCPLDG